ncbi:hypothetical protein KIN20_000515 [Parelaphostrongylus tenuis]|uniref:Uncharacterized protein n=1 Tax=Parelaphostrongylus tenuis TaxID=148309 RepID=A0AAD5MDS0_PARTN|nr:hypothetical protein KIN20_000515 [Parelaphostrongylus tenuis]
MHTPNEGSGMNDEQLRELFSSLATLAQQGPIPVQAYSILIHNHSPEALADLLHQRWLSDSRFVNIAANILLHMRKTNSDGLALSSCVLALLLNDYRNRLEIRSRSALMFRNSTSALFEMYSAFLEFDPFVAKCLVKPMFQSLDILLDEQSLSEDLETAGLLLTNHGATLNNLNSYLADRLIVKIRSKICSDDPQMNGDIRRIFLHVLDLWVWGWNELAIPECLTFGYFDKMPLMGDPTPERKCGTRDKEFGSKESVV